MEEDELDFSSQAMSVQRRMMLYGKFHRNKEREHGDIEGGPVAL